LRASRIFGFVWPEPVERIAAFLRAAGIPGRLEELPADADAIPDPAIRAAGFECDGRGLVVLVPDERPIDRDKVAAAAGCKMLRPASAPQFPFQPLRVLIDRTLVTAETVWLEVGTERYVLGLAPGELARLTHAETADLLLEA
jgi:prolyl-tRNA editing enzyme YbaK/EbsC (Cys-tRNA(Pro) deacylase)